MSDFPQKIAARVIFYAQTLAQWTSSNPVIPQGELVLEIGTGSPVTVAGKVGNGTSNYLTLPYILVGGAGGSGNLQNVLNAGNTATDASGAIGAFRLINSGGGTTLDADGGRVAISDGTGTSFHTLDGLEVNDGLGNQLRMSISGGTIQANDSTGNISQLNTSGQLIENVNTLGGGILSFFQNDGTKIIFNIQKPAFFDLTTNIVPPIISSGTHVQNYLLRDKGAGNWTVATLDDIPTAHPAGTPVATYGAAAGTSPGAISVTGDDMSGFIQFSTGTSTPTSGVILTLTFNTPFPSGANVFWSTITDSAENVFAANNVARFGAILVDGVSVRLVLSSTVALIASNPYAVAYQIVPKL